MKALVTGCAGFIGSHLADRLLSAGFDVIGIDCFTDYYQREVKESNIAGALCHKRFQLMEADIVEMSDFPEVDYVLHQAAQPGVGASWGHEFGVYVRNNILATQKLLEFYKDHVIKKFVYASSSSIYGDAELPLTEETIPRPVSPYGVTKLAAENLCYLFYCNFHLPVISLRYFTVYGPRLRPDLAIYRFADAILKGSELVIYGDGTQKRDFTHVDDVVQAVLLAMKSEHTGCVLNVGSSVGISVNELIGHLERILGREARARHAERQKGDMKDTLADITRARAMLNWEPKIGIGQGLSDYIDWAHGR